MSKVNIMGVDVENIKPKSKREELTDEQYLDLMLADIQDKDELHTALRELEDAYRAHYNAQTLIEAYQAFEDDKGLEAICSSEEAWNITDTLKKTLEKFKLFFKKAFEYINNFVVLRLTASSGVIKKWAKILGDSNSKKDRIEQIKKDYDVKDCTIEQMKIVIAEAETAFNKITGIVEQVKGLSPTSENASDIEKAQVVSELPEYKKFDEAYVNYEQSIPEGDNADTTKAVTAEVGKWFDAGSVDGLYKEIDKVLNLVKNMKRMQMSCNAIVTSLEKSSSDTNGTDKNVNNTKLKWLRDFSKNVMSGMIGRLTKVASRAASKCQTLTNMYNK